jgi:hypothetical protein
MKFHSVSLLLLPIIVTACSDSAGPDSGDHLTRAEALLIAGEVSGSVGTTSTAPVTTSSQDGIASDPFTFTKDLETSHPCPRGGTVQLAWRVDGTIDPDAGMLELNLEGTHKPSACAYLHEGVTLTITGDPDLDFAAHLAVNNSQPTEPFTASINGAFNWTASDGRSGRCSVAYEEVTDFNARKRTVDGDVCGHTIKETLSWGG